MRKSFLSLMTVMLVCVAQAATIKWYDDAPHRTPTDPMVVSVQTNGPNGYGYVLMSDIKSYVSNSIGGAFISNNGGEGTNTVLRGNTLITKAYGDGGGLTNLPGGSQVWTNDGTSIFIADFPTNFVFSPGALQDSSTDVSFVMQTPTNMVSDYGYTTRIFQLNNGTNRAVEILWNGALLLGPHTKGTLSDDSGTIFGAAFDSNSGDPPAMRRQLQVWTNGLYGAEEDLTISAYDETLPVATVRYETWGTSKRGQVFLSASLDDEHFQIYSHYTGGDAAKTQLYPSIVDGYTPYIFDVTNHSTGNLVEIDNGGIVKVAIDYAGVIYGNAFGLTNLNVIETNVYQTFNVKNLTVQSNLFYLQSRPQINAWSGPTNTLDFSQAQAWTYTALVPISITNIIGITNSYMNSALLAVTNASGSNLTATITASGWKIGIGDSLTWTNGDILQIWPSEMNGMKSIATKAYH